MEIILENQSALVKRKYLKGHRLERSRRNPKEISIHEILRNM